MTDKTITRNAHILGAKYESDPPALYLDCEFIGGEHDGARAWISTPEWTRAFLLRVEAIYNAAPGMTYQEEAIPQALAEIMQRLADKIVDESVKE